MSCRRRSRRRRRPLALVVLVSFATAALFACSSSEDDPTQAVDAVEEADGVEDLKVEVIAEHPHDQTSFTQGLLVDDGRFFESTGQYGSSQLREVAIDTGEPARSVRLPATMFGEGLELVGDRLVQLTWKERVARVYDRDTFEVVDEFEYDTEGWGLCLDDDRLVMSDGSATLTFRDPDTFEEIGDVEVTAEGKPIGNLNELECVDGEVYANVYTTNQIVVIDPDTGDVTKSIDATGLLTDEEATKAQVLNGIAYDHDDDALYLTGKYWPKVFEVRLVDASADDETVNTAGS